MSKLTADRRLQRDVERLLDKLRELEMAKQLERLSAATVLEGQRGDGRLYENGVDRFIKMGMSSMSTLSVPITGIERLTSGWLVTATAWVAGPLRKGLRRLGKLALGQMHNSELPVAGHVVAVKVDEAGVAKITCKGSNETAAQKTVERVYPMLSISHVDDEMLEVNLIDRPDDLAKRGGAPRVLAKLYDGKEHTVSKWTKRLRKMGLPQPVLVTASDLRRGADPLPASAQAALINHAEALSVVEEAEKRSDGDRNAARANLARAVERCQIEMIKGALSRPIAAPWAR